MSQFDFGTIDPYVVDGVELADFLNQWRDALLSMHRGAARPPYVVPGMLWISDAAGPTGWVINWYVSPTVGDKPLFTLNTVTGEVTISAASGGTLGAATLLAQAAVAPAVQWNATGNPIDQKNWKMSVSAADGSLQLQSLNDAGVVQQTFTFNRDGSIATPVGSLFMTGECKDLIGLITVAPAGWVLAIPGTIGNGASGASIRAAADCQNLYAHMWTLPNAYAPVTGGRGASALADFNAAKPIGGLDLRGVVRLTRDDQGGVAAGRAPGFTAGVTGGEPNVSLTGRQVGPHQHGVQGGQNTGAFGNTGRAAFGDGVNASSFGTSNGVDMGGLGPLGEPHNNIQMSRAVTTIIKL
jgi:hypothetical protein